MIRQIPKIALFVGALALAGQANADRGWGGPAVVGAIVGAAVVGAAVSSSRDRTVYVEREGSIRFFVFGLVGACR
ncbi:hypothetical protein [Pseudomonas syringae]|uniref:hypothetical protein n=1 Tax=Pseudomonas syringae TaxID=317 RepID=UPI0019253C3C|nr:hypothetical protein [Pseudomonas syringae]MBL3604488.1 hypothetical protein [Pseudomonas syringae pv. actinidiae]